MRHVVVELVEYRDGGRRRLGWTDQSRYTRLIAKHLMRAATAQPNGRLRKAIQPTAGRTVTQ